MTATLTPGLALALLRELSADLRAATVLDARGGRLAGPPSLAAAARALLDAQPDARALAGRTVRGAVFAARDDRHAVVALTGPLVLAGLAAHDLDAVLRALGGTDRGGPRKTLLEDHVTPLFDALDGPD